MKLSPLSQTLIILLPTVPSQHYAPAFPSIVMSYYHNYPSSCPIILSISLFLRHIEDSSNTSFSSQHASSSSGDQQQQQHDHNIHRHHKGEQQQISSSPHYQAANNNTLRQLPDTSWLAQQAQQTEGGSKVCSLHL